MQFHSSFVSARSNDGQGRIIRAASTSLLYGVCFIVTTCKLALADTSVDVDAYFESVEPNVYRSIPDPDATREAWLSNRRSSTAVATEAISALIEESRAYGNATFREYLDNDRARWSEHERNVDKIIRQYNQELQILEETFHEDDQRLEDAVRKAQSDMALEMLASGIEFGGQFIAHYVGLQESNADSQNDAMGESSQIEKKDPIIAALESGAPSDDAVLVVEIENGQIKQAYQLGIGNLPGASGESASTGNTGDIGSGTVPAGRSDQIRRSDNVQPEPLNQAAKVEQNKPYRSPDDFYASGEVWTVTPIFDLATLTGAAATVKALPKVLNGNVASRFKTVLLTKGKRILAVFHNGERTMGKLFASYNGVRWFDDLNKVVVSTPLGSKTSERARPLVMYVDTLVRNTVQAHKAKRLADPTSRKLLRFPAPGNLTFNDLRSAAETYVCGVRLAKCVFEIGRTKNGRGIYWQRGARRVRLDSYQGLPKVNFELLKNPRIPFGTSIRQKAYFNIHLGGP